MIDPQLLARVRATDPSVISDCMLRLGLSGWMDGVRPVKPGVVRAAGRARTLLFGPRRGEGTLQRSLYATIAELSPDDVLFFYCDHALAVKASIPRPVPQGDLADSDGHGGQQYAPLMDIEIP